MLPPQERAPRENRPRLFDAQLFVGPVGLLALSGVLKDVAYLTFISAVPLYLVNVREVPGYRLELTPFGGIKDSGLGYKEGVLEAMKSFTNVKTYSLPW